MHNPVPTLSFATASKRLAQPKTIVGAYLVVAIIITDSVTNESVAAFRPAVAVVAVLAIEVALEIEALLVAHAIVHERVEASRRRVANVAVAAV